MATKMTAYGVSTTNTPGTEQYEVFYNAYRHGVSITNMTIVTPTENFSPASPPLLKSADNGVMNG